MATATGAESVEKELQLEELGDGTVKVVDPNLPSDTPIEDEEHEVESEDGAADEDKTEREELDEAKPEERTAIQERRRQERKDRKQRAQERESGLRRDLQSERDARSALEQRISLMERKTTGTELAQLDGAIGEAEAAVNIYKKNITEATNRSDGAAVADATEKMVMARERAGELKRVRESFTKQQQSQAQGGTRQSPPPELVAHASAWMSKHSWYDPNGKDTDSKIAIAIDQGMASEGRDPRSADYWTELDNRIKQYLPHRAGGKTTTLPGTATRKPGKSVVTGSSRETAATGGREFTLSADRVKALKDAGMWDDTKARASMIKDFMEYDRKAAAASKT